MYTYEEIVDIEIGIPIFKDVKEGDVGSNATSSPPEQTGHPENLRANGFSRMSGAKAKEGISMTGKVT